MLEVGCFEGVHTIGLLSFTSTVVALDSRIENVTKTLARCAAYGVFPKTYVLNIDDEEQTSSLPEFEVLNHVGVLYHLFNQLAISKYYFQRFKPPNLSIPTTLWM